MNENILDRLNDIESKYLFQEDTLERLSIELRKQQKDEEKRRREAGR